MLDMLNMSREILTSGEDLAPTAQTDTASLKSLLFFTKNDQTFPDRAEGRRGRHGSRQMV